MTSKRRSIATNAMPSIINLSSLSRRDFLKLSSRVLLAVSGLLGVGAIWRFLSHPTEPLMQTEFDVGPVENYPPGSRTLRPEVPAVVIHDEAGFAALSLVCPHLGCTVEQTAAGFACPCHGSTFASSGAMLTGPAGAPLPALQIEQNPEGHLVIYTQ
jgi:nitrite reductase/ring-hydroxylating ferredoxin subunit